MCHKCNCSCCDSPDRYVVSIAQASGTQFTVYNSSGPATVITIGDGTGNFVKNQQYATDNQLIFTIPVAPSRPTDGLDMSWGGIPLPDDAYTYVGTTVTYIPSNNGGEVFQAGDRINFKIY